MHMYVCIRIANTINFIVIIMIFSLKKSYCSALKKNSYNCCFVWFTDVFALLIYFFVHIHMHNDAIYYRNLKSMQFERTSNYLALKSYYNYVQSNNWPATDFLLSLYNYLKKFRLTSSSGLLYLEQSIRRFYYSVAYFERYANAIFGFLEGV